MSPFSETHSRRTLTATLSKAQSEGTHEASATAALQRLHSNFHPNNLYTEYILTQTTFVFRPSVGDPEYHTGSKKHITEWLQRVATASGYSEWLQ